jgi:hypothetical protein
MVLATGIAAPAIAGPGQYFAFSALYVQPDGSLEVEVQWYGYVLDKISWGNANNLWAGNDYFVPPWMQNTSPHMVILGYIPAGQWSAGDDINAGGWYNNVLLPGAFAEDDAP